MPRGITRQACIAWTCVALTTIAAAADGAQTRRPFSEILADYRTADADAAVRELALWPYEDVVRHAQLSPDDLADPWTLAAVALLHLEAGLANDTFDTTAPDVRVIRAGNLEDIEIHARTAYRIMEPLAKLAAESRIRGSWSSADSGISPQETRDDGSNRQLPMTPFSCSPKVAWRSSGSGRRSPRREV